MLLVAELGVEPLARFVKPNESTMTSSSHAAARLATRSSTSSTRVGSPTTLPPSSCLLTEFLRGRLAILPFGITRRARYGLREQLCRRNGPPAMRQHSA